MDIVNRRYKQNLLVFERQILRRIYGPVQTEEGWRIRNNDKLEKLMREENVVKYIRAQRIKLWGHLNRMGKNKNSEEDYGMECHRCEI
jgi:hypothetical protein